MAYRVDLATARRTFDALDYREQNGYQRREVVLEVSDAVTTSAPDGNIPAIVYIAGVDNHAFLGPAPLPDMVRQIAASTGPSGRNVDYLLELAAALRTIQAEDAHVFELEAAVRKYAP
jgi:cation transport regulator ChaC